MMSQEEQDARILQDYTDASNSALARAIEGAESWAKRHSDSCIAADFLHRADVLRVELRRRIKESNERGKNNG